MKQDFDFAGSINGVKYTDPQEFTEALKKATIDGTTLNSVSYHYSSTTDSLSDTGSDTEEKECNCCKDTAQRVKTIRDIIQQVADFSEEISYSDTFTDERLSSIKDTLSSSVEKIKYLISGMQKDDRKDFCSKMLDGMRRLFEEADSECKDLAYEEAKYRQELKEDNDLIQEEIDRLGKDFCENDMGIRHSYNRCKASEDLRNFFGDLVSVLEIF